MNVEWQQVFRDTHRHRHTDAPRAPPASWLGYIHPDGTWEAHPAGWWQKHGHCCFLTTQTLERQAPFDSNPDASHERRRQDVLPKKEHQQHTRHLSAIKASVHVKYFPLPLSWREGNKRWMLEIDRLICYSAEGLCNPNWLLTFNLICCLTLQMNE